MNIEIYKPLWIKIQNFPLDDANAVTSFSKKLAHNQNWSAAFTKRVTEEYKKFIFLCCISENGASPSQIVDEAWHLHLTYTTSYWTDFCKNTLGKDIHHHPSKGGSDENHRHEEWYSQTLQLYENVFGISPPTDIWPVPEQYEISEDLPEIPVDQKTKKWAVAIIALPFLFSVLFYQKLNPYSLTGHQFLVFYFFFGLAIIASCGIIQYRQRSLIEQVVADNFPVNATIYQMTRFLYGKHRAIQTAMVDLIRRNLLGVDNDKTMYVLSNNYIPDVKEENPLAIVVGRQSHGDKIRYEQIVEGWYKEEAFAHPALERLYEYAFYPTPFQRLKLFYVALIVIGGTRMLQGLYNGRPIGFLVFETIILGLILWFVYNYLSRKSQVFKKSEALFKENFFRKDNYKDYLINDFAINGSSSISGFAEGYILASIFDTYPPLTNGGANASGGSCSSCSGGSSCGGGGGCGGGGCGGCGGGD